MNSKRVVFSGSFDPITNGHVELICRASKIFDSLCVVVCSNSSKNYFLPPESRKLLIEDAVSKIPNVSVDICDGLFADYCCENNVEITLKGVRGSVDYEYERSLCRMNEAIFDAKKRPHPETVLMLSDPAHEYCSSTFVREMIKYGEDCTRHVPNAELLERVLSEQKKNKM